MVLIYFVLLIIPMIKKIFLLSLAVALAGFTLANDLQIVIDPVTKEIYVTSGATSTTPVIQEQNTGNSFNFADVYLSGTTTGTETSTETETGTDTITAPTIQIDISAGANEFEQALAWMYANGLTQYNTAETYRPADRLTREEAAKIIGEAYRKLGYPTTTKNEDCTFTDAAQFDPTLVTNIQDVCARGLFQGSQGRFLPTEPMTKGQALAVLIRMLEGKKSDESMAIWWENYHKKWVTIGLTTDVNVDNFANPITREEIAIFIYRTREIVQDEQRKIFSLNAMSQLNETGTSTQISNEQHLQSIASGIDVSNDPELQEAISWMYENGFTIHQSTATFQPFTLLNREQAAKIINTFAGLYGWAINLLPESSCTFTDLGETPEDLIPHIVNACRQWLVVWVGNRFNPKQSMTKAQFIVALIRLLEGKQLDERTDPWWKNYFELARAIEVVGPGDAITFDNAITRYEVAVFLYRFKVKYLILKNLNNSRLPNEIVSMLSWSIKTGVSGLPEAEVFVNVPLLADSNFSIGYIDTFGTRQKIVRTSRESFFTNNLVRYGDIFDMETDAKIGTVTFIIGNGFLIEGRMRYTAGTTDYVLTAIPGNQSLYAIRTVNRATQTETWSINTETNTGTVATGTVQ
jgi:hypothetical protein